MLQSVTIQLPFAARRIIRSKMILQFREFSRHYHLDLRGHPFALVANGGRLEAKSTGETRVDFASTLGVSTSQPCDIGKSGHAMCPLRLSQRSFSRWESFTLAEFVCKLSGFTAWCGLRPHAHLPKCVSRLFFWLCRLVSSSVVWPCLRAFSHLLSVHKTTPVPEALLEPVISQSPGTQPAGQLPE